MNILSPSQFTSPNTLSVNSVNAVAQRRVGQSEIENRGSVIQPIDELGATATVKDNQEQSGTVNNSSARQAGEGTRQDERQTEILVRRQVQELAARDREVRNHERAHAAVGGQYAGSPRYTFERGPDGINYAVGGEVSISVGAVSGDPEATIQKAQVVRRAALAPTEPSAQDRSVAAQAVQLESQARNELRELVIQERIAEEAAAESRVENRDGNAPSIDRVSGTPGTDSENISTFDDQESRNKNSIETRNTDSRVQQLSEELTRRITQADPFGAPEPGQFFNQFI